MKKFTALLLMGLIFLSLLSGCSGKAELDPENPVTLTMWHVYGEQADSPMNKLVEEFNRTTGKEKGIIINVALMSSTAQIGEKLLTAQKKEAGAMEMPDLFFCHNNNVAELGADNLLDWKEVFTEKELESYVPEFLEDGMVDGKLSVFPVSKSTHLLFVAGTPFERFSNATGVTYDSLSNWDGFLDAAEKYYEFSGGKPFCALDFPIRAVELNAMEQGENDFYTEDGWYDFENSVFKDSWLKFAESIAKGHIVVSDLYSNTQIMTGEVVAGLGSTASILYYNDTVTYPDNTSEPINLQILPPPTSKGKDLLVTQAGVGLCAYKTTEQKAEAGLAKTGKDHGCMPHRKWRLEFSTNLFPNYDELKSEAAFPLNQNYRITDVVLLPGTDQHVMLMTVPLLSKDGFFYGICGFELNEGYFKQIFAQPSELDRAIFCISKSSEELILSESTTLCAGVLNEYYLKPHDTFTLKSFGGGLTEYCGKNEAYIGVTKGIRICPGTCTSAISVMIPKSDYERMATADMLRIVLLIIIFSLALVALSFFFARRFLQPIKSALDSIRKKEYSHDTAYSSEITDLFAYLAEQDRAAEEELDRLRREKADALSAADELKSRFDETEKQNKRLAYSRKDEIDPLDYENFKKGLHMLTGKEKEVLNFYLQGKTVKEIIELLGLQESTVRFHNKNIYSKLGVHSLKQLLRYAAVSKQEENDIP